MRRILLMLVLSWVSSFAAAGDDGIVRKTSANSVREKGFTVFARIDHAAGAKKVGQELRPTQLLIFGNPKVGTALLQGNQSVGLDLPIRVVAWEGADGAVWVAYNDPAYLTTRHQISDRDKVVGKMTGALQKFTDAAASK